MPLSNVTTGELITAGGHINAWIAAINGLSPATSQVTTTGTITALPIPSGTGPLTIFMANASLATVQGIAAGLSGQTLTLVSTGVGQVDIANENAGASAANRIINGVTGTISLAAGSGKARLVYDGNAARWRVVQHAQGAWITPAFNAADYTAATGTWGVDSSDVATLAYALDAGKRELAVAFVLNTTSPSAVTATLVRLIPGGYTAAKQMFTVVNAIDNAARTMATVNVDVGGTTLIFQRNDAASWSNSTNGTYVRGAFTCEVQ